MSRRFHALVVALPLLAGFLIYFSCRSKSLLYYRWIPFRNKIFLDQLHDAAFTKCHEVLGGNFIAHIVIFSAPAALFAFSLAYYVKARYLGKILSKANRPQKTLAYLALIVLIAYIPEFLQQTGTAPGRFDEMDVLTAGLATLLALYIA